MKNTRKKDIRKTAIILGGAIIAPAWLIAGQEFLSQRGINGKINDLLVWMPAMIVFFGCIAGDKRTLACEARAFRRLIGR